MDVAYGRPVLVFVILNRVNDQEEQATDKYFLSETHAKLVDESTGLYQKPWRDIYELFLQELNLKK